MLKIAFAPIYIHPLPEKHRFPMIKYELLPEQLLYEGAVESDNFFSPPKASEAHILSAHKADYWQKLSALSLSKKEERRTGFPHSRQLIEREITIMEGSRLSAEFALEFGVSFNIAGGTHHAYSDRGEGFCLLNDIAISALSLLESEKVSKVLVVDLDVHQGNGTAEIFRNDHRVFTFSMHGAGNYPHRKEKSDLDIGLPDGTDDREYLKILRNTLPKLIDEQKPEFMFFQSGVDVLETDKLGRLSMSLDGCRKRDAFVFESCKKNNIPVQVSMGGGYSPRPADIVEAHANTYRTAMETWF